MYSLTLSYKFGVGLCGGSVVHQRFKVLHTESQLLFIWEGRRWEYVLLWFCSLYTSGMWKLGKFLTGKDTGQCWKVLPLQIPITIENIYRGNWFREIVLRPKMLIYIPYTDFIPSDFAHGCIAHRNAWMCKRIKKKNIAENGRNV